MNSAGSSLGRNFLLLLFFFLKMIECTYEQDCYANDREPYLDFGTKTSYEFVYEGPKQGERNVPDCNPVQIWLLARYGARYPGAQKLKGLKELEEIRNIIIRNHEFGKGGKGKLCYQDVENLKRWSYNLSENDAGLVTKQGESDLNLLARRLRTKYSLLFNQGYSPNLYVFRTTESERAKRSAKAFTEGLFGRSSNVWIPPAWENDPIIKPYSNCSYWRSEVGNNPKTHDETKMFTSGHHINNMVHNVSKRLGFINDLQIDTILKMYDMCRYDKAWRVSELSPWCAAFKKEDLQVLEYMDDLDTYYESGPGHSLNLKLGCSPLKDMMERFEKIENENYDGSNQPIGIFYFAHTKTLLMTLSKLEIAEGGEPLTHDNYDRQRYRQWRTSKLAPFTGNLAAVFYKCSVGDKNKVMFLLNEKVVEYKGCDLGLCSWSYLRTKFQDIPNCNLDWCHSASSRMQILLTPLIIFTILHIFI